MNISEVAGVNFTFKLGGKTFKARRLSIGELFGYFEDKVKAEIISDAKDMSEILPESQRNSFLIQAWKEIPKGDDLSDRVTARMATPEGMVDLLYLATRNENDEIISPDSFNQYITLDNMNELGNIIAKISGMDVIADIIPDDIKKK